MRRWLWGLIGLCAGLGFAPGWGAASPPACLRTPAGKFLVADAVVEARVLKSRRWREGRHTLHLVARYEVEEVFKGPVFPGSLLIVTDTCLDLQPDSRTGQSSSLAYCPRGKGLHLTGVRARDGTPVQPEGHRPSRILWLEENVRKGAPQTTWVEVADTAFGGSGCRVEREDLPQKIRPGFERLLPRIKEISPPDRETR